MRTGITTLTVLLFTTTISAQNIQLNQNLSPSPTRATDEQIQMIGIWGQWPHCVEVDDTTAYMGINDKLVIYNISNPGDPVELGRTDSLGATVLDIELDGTIAWVATEGAGVVGVDISKTSAPVASCSFLEGVETSSISIENDYAYVSNASEEMVVLFDIQTPASPTFISERFVDNVTEIISVNGMIYCARNSSSFAVLDFTDATDPAWVTHINTPDKVKGVVIQGNALAVACGEAGVVFYNISNPDIITEFSTYDTEGSAHDVLLEGTTAYIADGIEGVLALNISDITAPVFEGGAFAGSFPVTALSLGTTSLIAIQENSGFFIFESPNLYDLFPSAEVLLTHSVKDLQVDGDYLFVSAGEEGFFVFDATTPDILTPVAECPNEHPWRLDRLSVEDGTAVSLVPAGNITYETWIDVTDPLNPEVPFSGFALSNPAPENRPFHVAGKAVLSSTITGVLKYHFNNDNGGVAFSTLDLNGPILDIEVIGTTAFIANETHGLQIVDFSDYSNMTVISTLPLSNASKVIVLERYAYVQTNDTNITIIDILDPTDPVELGSITTYNAPFDFIVQGHILLYIEQYESSGNSYVITYDISKPHNPTYLEGFRVQIKPSAITIFNNHAWVAFRDNSFAVLELPDSYIDCNGNNIPDEQDLADGTSEDCNLTGIPDECEVYYGIILDCNTNGARDDCDIASGTSEDTDNNGVPDECESGSHIIFVDDDAPLGGNGHTWETAYRYLQDALSVASTNDQVWVAEGLYNSDQSEMYTINSSDREIAFHLRDNIQMYGGFAGNEDPQTPFVLADRDFEQNTTILSGDLFGNDAEENGNAENCLNVVRSFGITEGATLDGFTITGGNADQGYWSGLILVITSKNTGGGFNIEKSANVNLANCSFNNNYAEVGGASHIVSSSDSFIRNCLFENNTSLAAGAVSLFESEAGIANCTITYNYADMFGGGITVYQNSQATITNTTISENSTNPDNFGSGYGGGIYSYQSDTTIQNCIVWNNYAFYKNEISGTATIEYSIVKDLDNLDNGNLDSDPQFASPETGDFRLRFGSPAIDSANNELVAPDITDLDGDGNTTEPSPFDVLGNPRFIDDETVVDTGIGTPPIVDMGAFENQVWSYADCNSNGIPDDADMLSEYGGDCNENGILDECDITDGTSVDEDNNIIPDECQRTWYVNNLAVPGGDGTSWQEAFTTIQQGLDAAANGDEVLVSDGTYTGEGNRDLIVPDKNIRLHSKNGPETCIIDCEGTNHYRRRAFNFVDVDSKYTVVDGFTITNGYAPEEEISPGVTKHCGGAILCFSSSPTIKNCILQENRAEDGGGIAAYDSDVTLLNCRLIDNSAEYGGGIYSLDSSFELIQSILYSNYASSRGGGLYQIGANSAVYNCVFLHNHSENACEIFHNSESPMTVHNSIIWNPYSWCTHMIVDLHETVSIDWSCLSFVHDNGTNIFSDPLFIDPENGDFHVASNSPVIDAGNNDLVPESLTTDLDGLPRFTDDLFVEDTGIGTPPVIDMGVYEHSDCNGNGIPDPQDILDGTSADCNNNLIPDECEEDCNQNGIADECDIRDGTSEDLNQDGMPDECVETFYVNAAAAENGDGTSWQTAFRHLQDALSVAAREDQIWVAEGVYRPDLSDDNSILPGDRTATFLIPDGIQLLGGFAGHEETAEQRNPANNPTILSGDLLSDDSADFGNMPDNAYHILTVDTTYFPITVDGLIIEGGNANGPVTRLNFRDRSGAGLFTEDNQATVSVTNCIFRNNTALLTGGAVCNWDASQTAFFNCLFHNNRSELSNGGILHNKDYCNVEISNCTFADNTAPYSQGVAISNGNTPAIVSNSILYGNTTTSGAQLSGMEAIYCLIEGGAAGEGNIQDAPSFVDPASGNYRLVAGSAGIDAGNSSIVPVWLTTDLAGLNRIAGTSVDMGVYEYQPGPLTGDADQDGDVDLADFAGFQTCFESSNEKCHSIFDLDADGNIDLNDFMIFESQITGPDTPE